jgi:hypothetical protein
MYIFIQDNQLVILVLYVDDVILVSNDVDGLLIQLKCKLAKEFSIIDLGHINAPKLLDKLKCEPKAKQWKSKELGHALWFATFWG